MLWQFTVAEEGDPSNTFVVRFEDDNYTGPQGPDLIPAESPIVYSKKGNIGGDSPNWVTASNSLEVNVIDEDWALIYLAGISEKQVKCTVFYNTGESFIGWVVPGGYTFQRHNKGRSRIEVQSGVSLMKSVPYADGDGVVFSGLDTAINIIHRCLSLAGETLAMTTSCHWYPFLTNQLSSTDDILSKILLPQDEFAKDEDGNALSVFQVLELVLSRFQLQMFQHSNRWYILQRNKNGDLLTNVFDVFNYPETGPSTSTMATLQLYNDLWTEGGDDVIQGDYRVTYTRGYKWVSATYNHKTASSGVITDPSFELTEIQPFGTGSTGLWEVGTAVGTGKNTFNGEGGTPKSASMDSQFLAATPSVFPDDLLPHDDFIFQDTGKLVEGGAGRQMQVQSFIYAWKGSPGAAGEAYFMTRWNVGAYWVYRDNADGLYKWTTNSLDNRTYLVFSALNPVIWYTAAFVTEEMLDGGTDISGNLRVELYAPKEDPTGIAVPGVADGSWDNVNFEIIGVDNDFSSEALQTTAVYTGSSNTLGNEQATFLFGDGPGPGAVHDRRMRVIDGLGNQVDLTGDWQIGTTFTAASDRSIDQLWVNERLRERKYSLEKITYTKHLDRISSWSPFSMERDRRFMTLTRDVNVGDTVIYAQVDDQAGCEDQGPILPFRFLSINFIETHRPIEVMVIATGEWQITLETGLAFAYTTNTTIHQDIFYTWNSQRYDAINKVLRVDGREFILGDDDEATLCSFDVKPSSEAKTQIATFTGIPCFEDIAQEDIKIYMINDTTGNFYYQRGDFSDPVDTGLNLLAQDIIDIDRNQVTGRIYGLSSNGEVYSWTSLGQDLQLEFQTFNSQWRHIAVNNAQQILSLSKKTLVTFNDRTHFFSLTGTPLFDWENRNGFTILNETQWQSDSYAYLVRSNALYRMRLLDGLVETLQDAIGLGGAAWAMEETTLQAWHIVGSAIYRYDAATTSNPANATFVNSGNILLTSAINMDVFRNPPLPEPILVGHSAASPMWSITPIAIDSVAFNRTPFNVKCLCTKRDYTALGEGP